MIERRPNPTIPQEVFAMRFHYEPEFDYDFPPDDGPTRAEIDDYYADMQAMTPGGIPSSEELADMALAFGFDDNPF
jgi:hypothetical protein